MDIPIRSPDHMMIIFGRKVRYYWSDTHFSGREELYTQMGFFLFRQFWPIDRSIWSSQRVVSGITKHVHLRFWKKRFFWFSFSTGSYRGLKFCVIIRQFLFTFSVIFAKIWNNFANIIWNTFKFLTVEFYCYCIKQKNVAEPFDLNIFG